MREYGDLLSHGLQALAQRLGLDPVVLIYLVAGVVSLVMCAIIVRSILRLVRPERIKVETQEPAGLLPAAGEDSPQERPPPSLTLASPFRSKDSLLPTGSLAYLAFVALISAGVWLLGYALTAHPDRLLLSPEWRWQPLYLASHFIVLRLFLNAYMRNYRQGVQHFDIDAERAVKGLRRATGWLGRAAAAAIAAPFAWADYRYLTSGRYETLAGQGKAEAADLVMWGVWALEWLLNGFIWVVVIGFALKNVWLIRRFKFKAPIETVVHDKHYRPFLRMSAQGSTVLFGFAIVTLGYIALTGGELTDYLGLFLTMLLVIASFLVPFTLLRAKVTRDMRNESWRLRRLISTGLGAKVPQQGGAPAHLVGGGVGAAHLAIQPGLTDHASGHGAGPAPASTHQSPEPTPATLASVSQRLDQALALLRLQHLEQLSVDLGGAEARQLAVRIAAPFITIAWNQRERLMDLFNKIVAYLQAFALR